MKRYLDGSSSPGAYDPDLVAFFNVNTDIGSPELAHAAAPVAARRSFG